MNTVILIGRLVKDPEINYTPSGQAVTKFTIAVDRNNEKKETDFLNCVSFAKLAETVNNYCKKGRQIAVTGRIQVRNYEASDGRKVYVTEILANSVEFLAESKAQQEAPTGGILTGAKVLADDDCPFD